MKYLIDAGLSPEVEKKLKKQIRWICSRFIKNRKW